MPLLLGWNAVVVDAEIPREEHTPAQTEEVNCAPLSEVMTAGTPNLKIQLDKKMRAQNSAEIELNGATSCHQVVRSIIVRGLLKPLLDGREPTMSI